MQKKKKLNRYTVISVISLIVFFVGWELIVRLGLVDPGKLSAPSSVIELFIEKLSSEYPDGATIQANTWASLRIVLEGFAMACIIGIPLGLLMGFFEGAERFFRPIFEMLRPIPTLAWVPIVLLIFGIGDSGKVCIIFIGSMVSLTINTWTGIRGTKKVLLNVAQVGGASRAQMFFRVGIPSAIPMIFTGMRISLGIAFATLVAAEMVAATIGLGYMMNQGRKLMDTDLIFLGVVVIGIIGFLINYVMSILERNIAPWSTEEPK